MDAGRLDRRVTLQRATTAADAYGERVQTWADLATVWAEKIESGRLVAREQADAGEARVALARRKFRIRWSETVAVIDASDRLLFEGDAYDILGVTELGRREGLEIECTARAD